MRYKDKVSMDLSKLQNSVNKYKSAVRTEPNLTREQIHEFFNEINEKIELISDTISLETYDIESVSAKFGKAPGTW